MCLATVRSMKYIDPQNSIDAFKVMAINNSGKPKSWCYKSPEYEAGIIYTAPVGSIAYREDKHSWGSISYAKGFHAYKTLEAAKLNARQGAHNVFKVQLWGVVTIGSESGGIVIVGQYMRVYEKVY